MAEELVILVDEHDQEIGSMGKLEVHQKGLLHRAFSVFIFNKKGELLLQQRAADKYHSPQKWTNTCCSHQRIGETTLEAAKRRLQEEMGFVCDVEYAYSFIYKADVGQGLYEHELDHVLIGEYEGEIPFTKSEVMDFKYSSLEDIDADMILNSSAYTEWFKITYSDLKAHIIRDRKRND